MGTMKCTKEYRLLFTEKAKYIVSQMTLEEKVDLMGGNISFEKMVSDAVDSTTEHYNCHPYPAGGNEKFGVPPMLFCDGPRGVVCGVGESTCFPVSMLRGATFDTDLEERIGRAIGREVLAHDGNLFAGVCVNLPYHPGWGRSQESYGEETFAVGRMGAALVRGVQEENVMACVKHFAFNSMEISRFKVDVNCDRRTEREVYLPHFKDCIDAGAASVMSSYNLYKGVHCGQNDYLLRKVLKEEWDFDGFVMSDFAWGITETVAAGNAGQDMEMCATTYFGDKLVQAVRDGRVDERCIDESAIRIVRTLLAFQEARGGQKPDRSVLGCPEHAALALEAAQKGITLVKNQEVLPFRRENVKTLAVIGRLASQPNIGDHGSSQVYPPHTVSPLEGLASVVPGIEVLYCDGSDLALVKETLQKADAAVFVVGFDFDDEGEYTSEDQDKNYTNATGGDRKNGLGLHADEATLLEETGGIHPRTAVVLIGGNTITMNGWEPKVPAILQAYYPGQEGGTALAQILFGDVNPSGKLPFVVPKEESDLPTVKWVTENQYYEYYHGYTKLEKEGIEPLYPYGYGLSYTTFAISEPEFSAQQDGVTASCVVTNSGNMAGEEVMQLYVGFEHSAQDRPVKQLRGFARVSLQPGESKHVSIFCPEEKLAWFNPKTARFEAEAMEYTLYLGTSSASKDLLSGSVFYPTKS